MARPFWFLCLANGDNGRGFTRFALPVPFGGVKKSSTESFKEQGLGAIDFYTRIKTVHLDYSV